MSLVLALVFAFQAAAQQPQPPAPGTPATVLGDWDLTFATPQSSNTVRITFKQDGDKITASLVVPLGAVELSGAESDGALKMSGAVQIQGTTLPLALGARIQGETLSGLLTLGTLGEMAFTGKRPDRSAGASPVSAASPAGDGSNLTGKWNLTLTMANFGAFPVSAVFDQQGDTVTGTLSSPLGDLAVDGTMTGGALHLSCIAQTPQGNITVTMTGQVGPDGLTGKASVAGIGEADWTGVRAP